MGFDFTSTLIAGFTWGIVVFNFLLVRRSSRGAASRSGFTAAVLAALTMTVLHPAVYLRIDYTLHSANIARAIGNGLALGSAWAFLPVVARLAHHNMPRRGFFGSWWFLLVIVSLMSWLYSRALMPVSAPRDFQQRYGGEPAVAAARIVLFAYLGVIFFRLLVLSVHNDSSIRQLPRQRDRIQGRLQTLGWGCAVAYVGYQCLYLGLRATGIAPMLPYLTWLGHGLVAIGCVMLTSGIGFRAWSWYDRLQAYERLYYLWVDFREILAESSFRSSPNPSGTWELLRHLDLHLYHRAVEIRDGLLLLQPMNNANVGTVAADESGKRDGGHSDMNDVAEAVGIANAIDAWRDGDRRETTPRGGIQAGVEEDTDIGGELRRLERVAVAYRQVRTGQRLLNSRNAESSKESRMAAPAPTMNSGPLRLARIVTEVLAPTPLAVVVLVIVALHTAPTTRAALTYAGIGALCAPLLPFAYLVRRVRQGRVTDHHVRRREQRFGIILLTLACGAVAFLLLRALGAPSAILGIVVSGIAGLSVALAITIWWKISIHTGVAAGIVAVFTILFGPWMLLLVPIVALVCWARVAVGDHTPAQVVIGALVGAVVSGLAFTVVTHALR